MIDDLFAMFVTRLALVCIRILISELCILIVPFDKNNVKIDLVILNTKDSCDGSGLNTSESSKGSHP